MEATLIGPLGRTALGSVKVTIGRAPDNSVVVKDPKASSHHAEIRPEGQGYSVVDLGSTNGTFVNDQQLYRDAPRRLQNGDTIRIGDTRFSYEASDRPVVSDGSTIRAAPGFIPVQYPGYEGTNYGGIPPQQSAYTLPAGPSQPSYNPPQAPQGPAQPPYNPPQAPQGPAQPPYNPPQAPYVPPAAQEQYAYTPPNIPYIPPAAQQQYVPPAAQQQYAYTPSQGPANVLAPGQLQSQPPKARQGLSVWVIILIILVLILIVGSAGIFFVVRNNQIATNNANATSTAIAHNHITATARANITATAVANPYPPHTGTLALVDPLTDNSKGNKWDEGTHGNAACQFTGGSYHVSETQSKTFSYCTANATNFSDFTYQVEMTIIKGDCGGLVFRLNSTSNKLYFYEVCQNGFYSLAYYLGNSGKYLITPQQNSAIKTGLSQTNVIAVVANADTIALYVNQQSIDTKTDSNFSQGQIALFADDYAAPGTEVSYNNIKIWKV